MSPLTEAQRCHFHNRHHISLRAHTHSHSHTHTHTHLQPRLPTDGPRDAHEGDGRAGVEEGKDVRHCVERKRRLQNPARAGGCGCCCGCRGRERRGGGFATTITSAVGCCGDCARGWAPAAAPGFDDGAKPPPVSEYVFVRRAARGGSIEWA